VCACVCVWTAGKQGPLRRKTVCVCQIVTKTPHFLCVCVSVCEWVCKPLRLFSRLRDQHCAKIFTAIVQNRVPSLQYSLPAQLLETRQLWKYVNSFTFSCFCKSSTTSLGTNPESLADSFPLKKVQIRFFFTKKFPCFSERPRPTNVWRVNRLNFQLTHPLQRRKYWLASVLASDVT